MYKIEYNYLLTIVSKNILLFYVIIYLWQNFKEYTIKNQMAFYLKKIKLSFCNLDLNDNLINVWIHDQIKLSE